MSAASNGCSSTRAKNSEAVPELGTLIDTLTNTSLAVMPVYVAKLVLCDAPLWVWL
jgi:hypothetical protein